MCTWIWMRGRGLSLYVNVYALCANEAYWINKAQSRIEIAGPSSHHPHLIHCPSNVIVKIAPKGTKLSTAETSAQLIGPLIELIQIVCRNVSSVKCPLHNVIINMNRAMLLVSSSIFKENLWMNFVMNSSFHHLCCMLHSKGVRAFHIISSIK